MQQFEIEEWAWLDVRMFVSKNNRANIGVVVELVDIKIKEKPN